MWERRCSISCAEELIACAAQLRYVPSRVFNPRSTRGPRRYVFAPCRHALSQETNPLFPDRGHATGLCVYTLCTSVDLMLPTIFSFCQWLTMIRGVGNRLLLPSRRCYHQPLSPAEPPRQAFLSGTVSRAGCMYGG